MCKKLFIIGTGTDVGKTYISGLILKKLAQNGVSAAYFKAAMSGNQRDKDGKLIPGDALYVKEVSGIIQPLEEMCPYIYEHPFSPHLAARLEGRAVNIKYVLEHFKILCEKYEYITMEGSGGLLCPLYFDEKKVWLSDIIKNIRVSCLLVADAGLGVINNVGLTASYMRWANIPLRGIILNRFQPGNIMHEDNRKMCEYVSGVKVIACVEDSADQVPLSVKELTSLYE